MARVDGIGGVFLRSARPKKLAQWYRSVFGIPLQEMDGDNHYWVFVYRPLKRPKPRLSTVFAIMPAEGKLAKRRNQATVNYRVDDLDAFVRRLKRKGVKVDPIALGDDGEGQGKFTHLSDPEGNAIELWEPSQGV
jgi:glyoxylase I family protein